MKKPLRLSLILLPGAALLLSGLVWAICMPNFVSSGPSSIGPRQ